MIILGLDLETTGLDTSKDRVIELGWCLWDTERCMPLVMRSDLLAVPTVNVTEEIAKITGITNADLDTYGVEPKAFYLKLCEHLEVFKPEYILAHNGENYDKPLLLNELARWGIVDSALHTTPWLDSRTDLPFENEPDSRRLNHLAMEHGFINPFKHRALFDVLTMLLLSSKYCIEKIVENSKIPWVTMRALVDYNDRDLAKAQRFSWEKIGDKTYPKCWVKRIRLNQVEREIEACKAFKVVRIE